MSERPPPPTPLRQTATLSRGLPAALLGILAFPWLVHTAVVVLSGLGAMPLRGHFASTAILGMAAGVSAALARKARAAPTPAIESSSIASSRWSALATTLFVAGAIAFGASFVLALALPIVAYDALGYRLPVIASWLDAGRIAWVATDDPVRNGYPLGQEAVSAVIAAATGSMRLTGATSFLYVAAGALSIWFLAEASNIRRPLARAAAAVFLLVPMVILNAPSGYVDAAFAGATIALFSTAALLSERIREKGTVDPLLPACVGIAAAHVLALKGNGIIIVFLVGIGTVARTWRAGASMRHLITALALAVPGAFWALRNIVHTGNPFWPVELTVGAHTLFSGTGTMAQILDVAHNTPPAFAPLGEAGRLLRSWLETSGPASGFDDRVAGLGWAWPLLALPAIALTVRESRRSGLSPIVFVVLLTLACFVVQPMKWWPRYTLWVWGAGALSMALQAERFARQGRTRLLTVGLGLAAALAIAEGGFALAHANGVGAALAHGGRITDPRYAKNASAWVHTDFWRLGLDLQKGVCRGAWKPSTDNANLDGVLAQLDPRPSVHIVPDDAESWPEVRRGWHVAGCPELLLFAGSPVLPLAIQDPAVSVERWVAFDPLFVVRPRKAVLVSQLSP